MIAEGYGDARTLERRARKMEEWLAQPELLSADDDAEYLEIIEIDLAEVNEPIVCAPNDPRRCQKNCLKLLAMKSTKSLLAVA